MQNLTKFLSLLGENVDAILLTSEANRYYCTLGNISEGVALITKNGCCYYTDSRYIEAAENAIAGLDVKLVDKEHPYTARLAEDIQTMGIQTLGFEEQMLTVAEYRVYEEKLKVQFVPMQKEIDSLRWVKEDWELERIRKAQEVTDLAFKQIVERITPGMTEKQLQAELIYCLYKNGAEGLSFDPIVVSGQNTSLPHGVATDRVIREGDFVTMDFGVVLNGYCSDMTRTVAVGYATEEMKRVYDTVLQAQLAGIAATKAGIKGREVDAVARQVIVDAGYGEYFGHGYGHGIGLQVHESPNCNPGGDAVMEENMVSSAEPGIYLPGKFGVRIEDVVVFKADGCENITKSPKNLIII